MLEYSIDVIDYRARRVKATTIEEHALLQFIADNLGDETVEPFKISSTPSTYKK